LRFLANYPLSSEEETIHTSTSFVSEIDYLTPISLPFSAHSLDDVNGRYRNSGTNGKRITKEEIATARHNTMLLLEGGPKKAVIYNGEYSF
jgi:hypothetical protein